MKEASMIDAITLTAEPEPNTAIAALTNHSISGIIAAYIAQLDLKPRSKEAYRKGVNYFFSWLEEAGINKPQRADVIRYKEDIKDRYSASTASSYLTAIRSFFEYLNAETGYPNITAGIHNPKIKDGHKKDALSVEQAKALLASLPRETVAQKRDYAIVTLMLHTGLRTIEIERANIDDIRTNLGAMCLFVWGKGRDTKDEFIKITPSVQKAINEYLEAREEQDGKLKESAPLFASVSRRDYGQRITSRSVSRICKEALKAAGLNSSRLTAHSLRHTAATNALIAGASIRDTQKMMRHKSPLTTERYAHDLRRLEDAAEDRLEELLAS